MIRCINSSRSLICVLVSLLVSLQGGVYGADILLVSDTGEADDAPGNQSVIDRLTSLGHTTTLVDDDDSVVGDADGKDLVIISSRSNSGDVGTIFTDQDATFRDSQIPTINWENALTDEFLISDTGAGPTSDSIVITALGATHPLGAGLAEGAQVVRDSPTGFHGISTSNLASGAQIIAEHTDGNLAIVVVEPGGLLNDGSTTASARRISMFFGDESLIGTNAAGGALFDAAVNYALIPEPSTCSLVLLGILGPLVVGRRRRAND